VTLPLLNEATLWSILREELDDATVNQLVWYYLGYRQDDVGNWQVDLVVPEWREAYPVPPNFIADRPPTVKLTRSIPAEHKQLLKTQLGFTGYQVHELVPRKTRRATMTSWLLSYMQSNHQIN
jgi:hypothetical protein